MVAVMVVVEECVTDSEVMVSVDPVSELCVSVVVDVSEEVEAHSMSGSGVSKHHCMSRVELHAQ